MRKPALVFCCFAVLLLPALALAQSPPTPPSSESSLSKASELDEPAKIEPEESAEEKYKQYVKEGKEKYINEDLIGAILAFQNAYQVQANPKLLYNIGRIYERMSKFEKASEHYEEFVHSPDVNVELRRDALNRVKTLREITALDNDRQSQASANTVQQQSDATATKQQAVTYEADYTSAWITIPAGIATTALIGGGFHLMSNSETESANAPGMEMMRDTHLANADKYQLVSYIGYGLGGALTALGIYFALDPSMEPVTPDSARNSDDYNPRVSAGPAANGDGFSVSFDMAF